LARLSYDAIDIQAALHKRLLDEKDAKSVIRNHEHLSLKTEGIFLHHVSFGRAFLPLFSVKWFFASRNCLLTSLLIHILIWSQGASQQSLLNIKNYILRQSSNFQLHLIFNLADKLWHRSSVCFCNKMCIFYIFILYTCFCLSLCNAWYVCSMKIEIEIFCIKVTL